MCKESDKNKEKVHWMTKVIFWVAMAVLISCSLGIIIPCLNISPDNIIIAFIGVLATFVVINNYTQIVELRNNVNEKLDEINVLREEMAQTNKSNQRICEELSLNTKILLAKAMKGVNGNFVFSAQDIETYSLVDDGIFIVEARVLKSDKTLKFYVDVVKGGYHRFIQDDTASEEFKEG